MHSSHSSSPSHSPTHTCSRSHASGSANLRALPLLTLGYVGIIPTGFAPSSFSPVSTATPRSASLLRVSFCGLARRLRWWWGVEGLFPFSYFFLLLAFVLAGGLEAEVEGFVLDTEKYLWGSVKAGV
ncbi:hypothetical protein B0H16DRAFT_525314 [Mycena metata]|uniref:Uncharacterized protein n=1 Tax=Mycena metata TaxID=1033252 RepID=A0AAD7H7G9_9AGAR|nr:hypothetical protein B0H16DRAFT_525314 [Mycena metata]